MQPCRFVIWKSIAGKRITARIAQTLLTRGETSRLEGFRSKADKPFAARLKLIDGQVKFVLVRQAREPEKLARAYEGLFQVLEDAKRLRILPFSRSAINRYLELRRVHRRVGRMDLAIAAIVLDVGGVLVTRNRADFELIEELVLQDWSRAK